MNRRGAFPQPLPLAPAVYDRAFLDKMVRSLNALAIDSTAVGDIVGASLMLLGLSETGYGLLPWSAWVDADGFLRLTRPDQVFAPSGYIRFSPGQVTVTV